MDSDLVSLDTSLELLDDVEGFDFDVLESEQVQDEARTSREAPSDEDRDLLQQLELIGDLDADLLKLIPDFDGAEDSEHGAPSTESAANTDLPRQDKPTGVQKSTRKLRHQRKKNELEYLKKQVVELEKELEFLKASSARETELQDDLLMSQRERGDERGSKGVSLWERVAKNQRNERVKAVVENMKLRERLEGQLKLAQSLEKLLYKRPADEDSKGEANQKMRARKLAGLRESEIFEILNDRVDGLDARVDAVMNDAGLATLKRERNDAQVKTGRVCVEMVDTKISPFAVHDVAEAAWSTLGTKRIELDNGYYKALECTNNRLRAEFCVTLRLRRAEALVRMHILGKRVVEEHRVVMVWATFGQTEGASFGMQCINLSEFGWTLVETITDERSADVGGTITQSCVRLTPELDDTPGQTACVGVLSDLVIGSYSLNMQTMHQEVENCLVQGRLV